MKRDTDRLDKVMKKHCNVMNRLIEIIGGDGFDEKCDPPDFDFSLDYDMPLLKSNETCPKE